MTKPVVWVIVIVFVSQIFFTRLLSSGEHIIAASPSASITTSLEYNFFHN